MQRSVLTGICTVLVCGKIGTLSNGVAAGCFFMIECLCFLLLYFRMQDTLDKHDLKYHRL